MNIYQVNDRNPLIDTIRGLCILAVILLHINIHIPFDQYDLGKHLSHTVFNIIFRSGYYGVIIFFVVSGFLITNSALNKWKNVTKINIGQFYRLRFARIAPCLLGLLIILSLFHLLKIKGFVITTTTLEKAIFSALTFHINWLEAKTGYLPGDWDVLWSLSVEEMFYIFFPIACLLLRKESIIKFMMIIFIILGPLARSYFYINNDIWSDHSYLSCMDGIAFGCLAALYKDSIKKNSRVLFIVGLMFSLFILFCRPLAYKIGLSKVGLNVTMLEIGIAFILVSTGTMQFRNILTAPLQWFGKNSYEIYLTHMIIILFISQLFYFMHFLINTMLIFYLLIIISTGIIGHVISKYFSTPLNRKLRMEFRTIFQDTKVFNNSV